MDEALIRQSLAQLQETYASLFLLMERALELAPDNAENISNLEQVNAEAAGRMQVAGGRLERFREDLGVWPPPEGAMSAALRGEIELFFNLLEHGLGALKSQVDSQTKVLRRRQAEAAAGIRSLDRTRRGVARYRTPGKRSKLLDSQA